MQIIKLQNELMHYSPWQKLCYRAQICDNILVGRPFYSFSPHRPLALFEQSIVSAPWLVPKALCGSVGHGIQHCKVLTSWDRENVRALHSVSVLRSVAAETVHIHSGYVLL